MNVLQVLPSLDEGGVETGTIDIARFLVHNGHKVVVISSGGKLVKKLDEIGARHYSLPVGRKSLFTLILTIPKIADIIRKENIQIVHARSRVPALASFFASKIANVPFITTAHGYYKKHIISRVMGWGRFVIVASNAMGYHMINNFGTPPENIRLIPRGVDLSKFQYKSPKERKSSPFTIGMISRISPIKGHTYFIQAIAQVTRKVPNLKVMIIGGVQKGKESYNEELQLLVKRLGLTETIKFDGPSENIPQLLSEMNILVLPSTQQEAFGRVIIEAQAVGVPVVATSVGGIVDIIDNGQTGILCFPEDAKDLADAIIKLAKDAELQYKIAESARRAVEEKFSLDKMASATLKLYEEAFKTKRILIIKLSAIGDVILSIPSLGAIRNKYKEANIKVLVGLSAKDILKNCPYIDGIIVHDYKGKDRGLKGLIRTLSLLRNMNFDISIDLQNNKRSHILAAASYIPVRIGYNNRKFSFLLNRKTKEQNKALDPISHQAQLLSILKIPIEDTSLELWPSKSDKEWANRLLEEAWYSKSQLLIGINAGASAKWVTKRWPVSNLAKLSDMLASQLGARILLTGAREDVEIGKKLYNLCKCRPIMAVGRSTILQLASTIAKCNVFITSDSAPMHIAAACKVNFVALFGSTDPARHMPVCKKCVVIRKNIRCSPCYRSKCLIGHRCMTQITVEEVFEAVKSLIGEGKLPKDQKLTDSE